ncbi:glycosyl transferase [Streptomyces sviceus ATCC 29083]|uniref:Glycosyl transferase n=2 Tax=Streptomyces TaxID=1883 RepID=B5HWK3_STRX2|nr:glycosyl transferase [Streptomyces sviceus ATCC 29083]
MGDQPASRLQRTAGPAHHHHRRAGQGPRQRRSRLRRLQHGQQRHRGRLVRHLGVRQRPLHGPGQPPRQLRPRPGPLPQQRRRVAAHRRGDQRRRQQGHTGRPAQHPAQPGPRRPGGVRRRRPVRGHRARLQHRHRRQPAGRRGLRPVRRRRGRHRDHRHEQRVLHPVPPLLRRLRSRHRLERGRRGQRLARQPVLRRHPRHPRTGRLRKRIMRRIARAPWELLKRAFGWLVLFELRNKVLLLPSAVRLRRLEDAETRRLTAVLGPVPQALVATVIATHRRPDALRAAVASALAQTVRDQVVIVVDDGAGLPELPDDPRLFAVSLARNTAVAGVVRNVGIRLTRSRYVAFLDDDNLWEPDHLERALAVLEAPGGPDGVYTALRRVLPDGTERDVLSVEFDRRRAARESFLDTNAFVARRDGSLHFSRLRRTPEVLPREDWELVYRYSRGHAVRHVPHATVRYLVNPASFYTTWSG